MNWKAKLSISLSIGIIFYILGNVIPFRYLQFEIEFSKLKTPELYTILINVTVAFVTFLAVIVALFKEDIRKIWEYARIEVHIPENYIFEKLNADVVSQKSEEDKHLEAQKYISRIEILNSGNISAFGTELYLEKLEYKSSAFTEVQEIETTGIPLSWSGIDKSSIIIPPSGKKMAEIVELSAPDKQSLPNGEHITIPPKLVIGNINIKADMNNGLWLATFVLHSQNTKSVRFITEIEWKGKWEKRLTEMKNCFKIEINNK